MSLLRKIGKALGILVVVLVLLLAGYLGYAAATAKGRTSLPGTPYPRIAVSTDAAVIERGRYLVNGPAHCSQCHGTDQREHPELNTADVPLKGGLEFSVGPIGVTWAANLTPDPDTGIGKRTDQELARAIRMGVLHDGTWSMFMRFAAAQLSDQDLGAVIAYLRSRPPVRNAVPRGEWKLLGKAMLPMFPINARPTTGPHGAEAGPEPTLARGAYLAEHVALCVNCHTPFDQKTFEPVGPKAAGGSTDPSHGADADMEFTPPNLTSHPQAGYTGRADEKAFLARLRSGRAILSSLMPWEQVSRMTEVDLRSIYLYLRSLPPVNNDLGPTYRKRGWKPGQSPAGR
jgi:mono/diheme cytochrome c family protein